MKRIIIVVACLSLPVLTYCEKHMDMIIREPAHFVDVIKENTFSFSDIVASLMTVYPVQDIGAYDNIFDLMALLDTSGIVHSTAITYKTTDPRGNEILASGLIMRPEGRESKGLLFFFPSAKIDKATAGTEMMLTFEGALSYFGYTVIVPDLVGYGVSSNTEYPFLFTDNTGQVAYDMHLACAEYFQSAGIPFPRQVTICGYSMGGMGVVALHRHIEQFDNTGIIIEKSYPGGGVYDLGMAMDILTGTRYCTFPFIPYMYVSMNHWYNLKIDYAQVFVDPLLSNMEDWLGRKYLAHELRQIILPDMTTYMHPDFFTAEKNESIRKVDSCLRFHSVIGSWAPKAPMTIIHTVNDDMAPYQIAEHMYNSFLRNGGNVSLVKGSTDHFSYGLEYYLSLITYMVLK